MTMLRTSGAYNEHRFIKRESLLTEYLQDKNFKATFTMLTCILLVLLMCNLGTYILDHNIFWEDLLTLWYFIPQVHVCVVIWTVINGLLICFVFPVTKCFVASRFKYKAVYLLLMIIMFLFLFTMPIILIFHFRIYLLSCAVVLIEQVRLLMKMISFVVENMKKEQQYTWQSHDSADANGNSRKESEEKEGDRSMTPSPVVPTLKAFLFFLVAPTLIYRDEYPTAKRNWFRAFALLFEMLVHVFALAMMLKFTAAKFKKVGLEPLDKTVLLDGFFASCVLSLMFVTGMTFGLWHEYENMWSEVLAFGDRQFYGPWWREKDLGKKIRFMNMIVSDFLYEYIYRPVRMFGAYRPIASYAVVVVSGIFHEYILWISLRFLCPVITVSMMMSIVVTQIGDLVLRGNKSTAMLVHCCVFVFVNSLVAFCYILEYYSRINCPIDSESLVDYFAPRTLRCLTFK